MFSNIPLSKNSEIDNLHKIQKPYVCYKEVFFIPYLHFQANWLEFMIVKLVLGAVRRLVRPRFTVLIFGCPERPKSRKSTANVLSKGRPFKGKYEVIVCQKKFY